MVTAPSHQLSKGPTPGPVKCARFDCQGNHIPQRCAVAKHASNKRVLLPNTNVLGSDKRPRINAITGRPEHNEVSEDFPADISSLEISCSPKGAIHAKCEYLGLSSSAGLKCQLDAKLKHAAIEFRPNYDEGAANKSSDLRTGRRLPRQKSQVHFYRPRHLTVHYIDGTFHHGHLLRQPEGVLTSGRG